jgi:hypothetical protein
MTRQLIATIASALLLGALAYVFCVCFMLLGQ